MYQQKLILNNHRAFQRLLGIEDENLERFSKRLQVEVKKDDHTLFFTGEKDHVDQAKFVIQYLYQQIILGSINGKRDLDDAFFSVTCQSGECDDQVRSLMIRNRLIKPRSANQINFLKKMTEKDITFGTGPAGTGKTFLAVAYGLHLLLEKKVRKIIITRPILEAGEKLGFLPGDMREKIDPYLRPIYDALYELLTPDLVERRIALKDIELAPLAFMRGRTLSNAFILLDEAQNTTEGQMRMFLTRIGEESKMVIVGDPSQTDLPPDVPSGLKQAVGALKSVDDIGIVEFEPSDIVRHPLIQKILGAFEKYHTAKS